MIKARTSILLIVIISLTAAQDQGILNYQKEDYVSAEKYYDSILSTNKDLSLIHISEPTRPY